jgi:hypothetical protein
MLLKNKGQTFKYTEIYCDIKILLKQLTDQNKSNLIVKALEMQK